MQTFQVPSSFTFTEYERMLSILVMNVKKCAPKVIARDYHLFFMRIAEQEMSRTCFARRILEVLYGTREYREFIHVSRKRLGGGSIVELAYVNATLARRVVQYITQYYIHSDHQAICHCRLMSDYLAGFWTQPIFRGIQTLKSLRSPGSLPKNSECCHAQKALTPQQATQLLVGQFKRYVPVSCFRARKLD